MPEAISEGEQIVPGRDDVRLTEMRISYVIGDQPMAAAVMVSSSGTAAMADITSALRRAISGRVKKLERENGK